MRIHGISLVKNEVDIISQTLAAAAIWCDFIYVLDNGSTDGTWEKVLEISASNEKIIPYKQDSKPFFDGMRGEIFNRYKENSEGGDWWCRLDADEFYIDDPRIFLSKISSNYNFACSASFGFYFTEKDLELYKQDKSFYSDEVMVEKKIRYYSSKWSEIRCVKHTKNFVWPLEEGWPISGGSVYPVRIWTKNYRYRSPDQIQRRIDTRREAMRRGKFIHELASQETWKARSSILPTKTLHKDNTISPDDLSWKDRVADSKSLSLYEFDGKFLCNEEYMPSIQSIENYINKSQSPGKKTKKVGLRRPFKALRQR